MIGRPGSTAGVGDGVVDEPAEVHRCHRVPIGNPRTEVGHLGVAFNTMVDRIEESFAERANLQARTERSEDAQQRRIAAGEECLAS